jgi:hypothetical protein
MEATRHQIVHQVVAAGHPGKNFVDKPLFRLGRDRREAEIRVGAGASFLVSVFRHEGQ